ncbi:MAG: hypothetical protein RL637_697 [Pseudomonadota bacterium]|jgi:hypothetical protein
MQLAIEFPDQLFFDLQETLPQQDLKQFVLDAVEAKLLQEKRKQQQRELMAMIKAIQPVKAALSSQEMTRMLRAGKDHELTELMNHGK